MRVAIGSDHAGFDLKEAVKAFLTRENGDVLDVGTYGREPVDYPDCAEAVGAALRAERAERGIIVCGSGVGASMAANRIPGVRAGLCHDTYSAHQGVEHDDMNVLVLGGRVVGIELARELVHSFLNARFSGDERHVRRIAKLTALENPLRALEVYGQSVWIDYMRRTLVTSGDLRRMIEEDGVRGVTSNPAIFEKAIAASSDYSDVLGARDAAENPQAVYERLAIRDIQDAADALRPVYDRTARRDGYVSLEVSPLIAYDERATLEEAKRLWRAVGRDNLMIKIPATPQGIPVVQQLIGEGINVNVTLLFALASYEQIAEAYVAGLETLAERGGDLGAVASVASFFISRIDSAVDAAIESRLQQTTNLKERRTLRALTGKIAVANAKLAYQRYRARFSSSRWRALAARGAQTQRLLWASTGTKNPAYRDVLYVEELIGPDTVNTMPPATLDAFREHGRPRASLTEDIDGARDVMSTLGDAGISIDAITDQLVTDGVQLFSDAFRKLLSAVERHSTSATAGAIDRQTHVLPAPLAGAVKDSLAEWSAKAKVRQLWARDASLWSGRDEAQWLGWLGITNGQLAHVQRFAQITEVARSAGFSHVLLLGMGGSSLGPEVIKSVFGSIDGFPELHVLDSTDPSQVAAFEKKVDLAKTLFIVSSKSGSTLEPNIFMQYFFDRVEQVVGVSEVGRHFIAVTDPGSKIQQIAESAGFRRVFSGWPTIGGRYSVLSDFGLVPAAIIGVNVGMLLDRTEEMVTACMPSVPVEENPGVVLGSILGTAAQQFGLDKMTIVAAPALASLGAWLEQLVAESTGKDGKGIIPIDRETVGTPDMYGRDRIFVHLIPRWAPDAELDARVDALGRAGHPVVRIVLDDPYDVGKEFFRWQIATAVAGSILGVNPFDQPDVEASKIATRTLTADYEQTGALPAEKPIFSTDGIELLTDEANAAALTDRVGSRRTLTSYLKAHLSRIRERDYFALLAYLEMDEANGQTLQAIRHAVRDATRAATCLQFGPRFLHSTGQAYKGGPNSGVFLQITCDAAADVPVPGQRYTFGVVKAAQARGDFQVLVERGRRALRVHLGADVTRNLAILKDAMIAAAAS